MVAVDKHSRRLLAIDSLHLRCTCPAHFLLAEAEEAEV